MKHSLRPLDALWDELHSQLGHEATVGADAFDMTDDEQYWASGAKDADEIERLAGGLARKHVLDYGCGLGRVSVHVIARCASLSCVDVSPVALSSLMSNLSRRGCPAPRGVWQTERLADVSVPAAFDLIYAWHVLFHLSTVQAISFIHDAYARLRPDGVLIFDVCNAFHPAYLPVLRHSAQSGSWQAGPFPHTPLDPRFLCYFATQAVGFMRAHVERRDGPQPAIVCSK